MGNKHMYAKDPWQQYKNVKYYGHHIVRFLRTQKQSLLTCGLLVGILVLLFGIFSQFQPPRTSTSPGGVTVIDYSTFVGQVKAGNVLAVIVQGGEIHGLLAAPFSQTATLTSVTRSSSNDGTEIAAWSSYVSEGYPSRLYSPAHSSSQSKEPSLPTIDLRRAIYTRLPGGGDVSLVPLLLSKHVVVSTLPVAQPPIRFEAIWTSITILFFLLIMSLALASRAAMRSTRFMGDHVTQSGKSQVQRFERGKEMAKPQPALRKSVAVGKEHVSLEPSVTFADVAGIDEVRVELEEIVQFLRSPEHFQRLGAHIPQGALLVGPPGTGKTLLAKAVAGEAGVPFFSMSASEFVEMFVGVGASRVRNLFQRARESAPCVIFIDELDAVGRQRSAHVGGMGGNEERDQTLNQLLVELDGFDSRQAVVVLAATNRVDILDKALLRPGRFDRHITVSLPDRAGREAILKVHTRQTPLHKDVSLERLSRLTTGMSGADLANLVNEAALSAARQNLEQVTAECFEDALARVQLGALRPLVMSEADRRIIAFHEGGHALVAYHLPLADTVNRVTILARGQSLGVTQFIAGEDRYNYSREVLMARIAVGLGGRVAEELAFGAEHVTTGAENDFQVVTGLARRMVTRWGMSQQVGVVFAGDEAGSTSLNMRRSDVDERPAQARSLVADTDGRLMLNGDDMSGRYYRFTVSTPAGRSKSTAMATLIDAEVQRILNEGYAMARAVLNVYYDQLMMLADALIEYEQLDRTQFEAFLQKGSEVPACLPLLASK